MRNQPINVCVRHVGFGQGSAGCAFKHTDGQFEYRLPVHFEQRVTDDFAARHIARHAQNTHVLAIGMQVAGQNARRV